METLGELIKIIEDNLKEGRIKLKGIPRRCILKRDFGSVKAHGYFIKLYYQESKIEKFLFISDISIFDTFHSAISVFKTKCFINRCLWVTINEVYFEGCNGFYI